MHQYLTGASVANDIRMQRSQFAGAFLLVEGSSDSKVFQMVVDAESCRIVVTYGRTNLLDAVRRLNADAFLGAVGVADADFDRIGGHTAAIENICFTDYHDLECMLLNSTAFERVLGEFAAEERFEAFASQRPLVAQYFAELAVPLGALRYLSLQDGLNLKFEGLKYHQMFKDDALEISQMVRVVLNVSQRHDLDAAALRSKLTARSHAEVECWQIVCGHDVMQFISIALQKQLSGKSSRQVSVDILEKAFRLAYSREDLRATALFECLQSWDERHPQFGLLAK